MLEIATKKLMLVAGSVWALVGINIASIGFVAYLSNWNWGMCVLFFGSAAIFFLFHSRIFQKMVIKHARRINGYQETKTNILKFFDKKGYIMMGIMMTVGIGLRVSGLVPDWFIAFFYTGLGTALAVAGITFLLWYFKKTAPECPVMSNTSARREV